MHLQVISFLLGLTCVSLVHHNITNFFVFIVTPSNLFIFSRKENSDIPKFWINCRYSMARDRLWQPVPNTHDNTCKLKSISSLIVALGNAPFLTNFSFEHGFFHFPEHCLQGWYKIYLHYKNSWLFKWFNLIAMSILTKNLVNLTKGP
jgi:hypothetical protein